MLGADGAPTLPVGYDGPDWVQIGTWAIAPTEGKNVKEQHLVFAERAAVRAYRETGKWPDGSTLVKELRGASPTVMSTGFSAPTGELNGWFVMVKGRAAPTKVTSHWGDGWYGAQYDAKDRKRNLSPGWASCRGCHTPVQSTDWVFAAGYPVLKR